MQGCVQSTTMYLNAMRKHGLRGSNIGSTMIVPRQYPDAKVMVCGNTVSDEAGTSMQLSRTTMMNAYKNIDMLHFFTRLMSHDQEQPVN